MEIEVKYFYKNGKEVKQGDLAYLEGSEAYYGLNFSGFFKIAYINDTILTVYFLGQDKEAYQAIEIEINSISVLMPVTNYGLIEEVEEMKKEIKEAIKNRN